MLKKIILSLAFLLMVFVLATQGGGTKSAYASAQYLFASPLAPPNDNFGKAQSVTALPYTIGVDLTAATLQTNEPRPTCADVYGTFGKTVWYSYKATSNSTLLVSMPNYYYYGKNLAVYTGSKLGNLNQVACSNYGSPVGLVTKAGVTYYFQLGDTYGNGGAVNFGLEVAPPPSVGIYYYPYDPSVYDTIYFSDNLYDPANLGYQSFTWNFGDGTTANTNYVNHQYKADGNYTVTHNVTTVDGRTGTASVGITVKTHDVAITQFSRPKTATAGQTKKLTISLQNKRYPETVRIELYRSVPGGFEQIGFLTQYVAVTAGAKTADYSFSYTFSPADAQIGKVVFKAIAILSNGRDAFAADNEFISQAVTVSPAAGVVVASSVDDMTDYEADTVSNLAEDAPVLQPGAEDGSTSTSNTTIYLPGVAR